MVKERDCPFTRGSKQWSDGEVNGKKGKNRMSKKRGNGSIKNKTKPEKYDLSCWRGKKYERNRKANERGENLGNQVKIEEIARRTEFRATQESRNSRRLLCGT